MKWRAECLKYGIAERDFWDMTIGEVYRAGEAYRERLKDRAYFDYTQALTIGLFIGSAFSGKSAPSIEEIYPDFFESNEAIEEAREEARVNKSVANFINFANAFNKRFEENGNREPESENNG